MTSKSGSVYTFGVVLEGRNVQINAMKIVKNNYPDVCGLLANVQNVNLLHARLGHCCEEHIRKKASVNGLKLTGTFQSCEECAWSKIKRER